MGTDKSNVFRNDFLKLIFQAVAIDGLAEDDTTSPVTDLTVALHTADPGAGGDQSTNEISYTGYARQSVPRDATGWDVTANQAFPADVIAFPAMAGGAGGTVTHVSVGTGVANKMLYRATLTPNIVVTTGVIPQLLTTSSVTEE